VRDSGIANRAVEWKRRRYMRRLRRNGTGEDQGVNMDGEEKIHQAADKAKAAVKKPYVKPAVRHEKVFETRALSCGKVSTTQGSCAHNRRSS